MDFQRMPRDTDLAVMGELTQGAMGDFLNSVYLRYEPHGTRKQTNEKPPGHAARRQYRKIRRKNRRGKRK